MIGLKRNIKKWFLEAVQLSECDAELKRKLLNTVTPHPRLNLFLDNLAVQFIKADEMLIKRGLFVKESTLQTTVYDMTKVFITTIEIEAKRLFESDLEKSARSAQASKLAEMDNFLEGGTDNEYTEELGLLNEEIKVKEAPRN